MKYKTIGNTQWCHEIYAQPEYVEIYIGMITDFISIYCHLLIIQRCIICVSMSFIRLAKVTAEFSVCSKDITLWTRYITAEACSSSLNHPDGLFSVVRLYTNWQVVVYNPEPGVWEPLRSGQQTLRRRTATPFSLSSGCRLGWGLYQRRPLKCCLSFNPLLLLTLTSTNRSLYEGLSARHHFRPDS